MIKQLLTIIIFASLFASCASETKNEGEKIYFDQPEREVILEDIVITEDNKSSFYLDGEIISPKNSQCHFKSDGENDKYTITSYTGSNGYFFEVSVPKGSNLKGEHSLEKEGNRLILNHTEEGLLTVYGSKFCNEDSGVTNGSIIIEEHDITANTITGSFTASVCNDGKIGEAGVKTLNKCKFNKISVIGVGMK